MIFLLQNGISLTKYNKLKERDIKIFEAVKVGYGTYSGNYGAKVLSKIISLVIEA